MRVVATTGMPGSGKGIAIEVAEELSFPVVSMGDLVREEAQERGLPDEPGSYGRVASELREQEGPGAWAERTVDRIRKIDADRVLIDGVRNLEEVRVFKRELGDNIMIVAVLASPETRYERMRERGRGEDTDDASVLRERDLRELGYGLGDVIAMADVYVENEGQRSEAVSTLRAVLGAGV